jgi:hypothetical protein
MKLILTGVICFCFTLAAIGQERFTISGYIKDAGNGEALIGATVLVKEIKGGTVSNAYGFYSITLPRGEYNLDYRYVGFAVVQKTIELNKDVRLDLELSIDARQLEEVVIRSEAVDKNVQATEMSIAKLTIKSIEKIPAFAGEVDIVKSVQFLPGVSTVGEGASGFNVRGGAVGQNLVLLDEAPVYQSSHMFGFFSVFNPDAVQDVTLYKGGVPSQYGGRLSSILDIRMKEGNTKEYHVDAGIGTIFSRLAIQGPIVKDKASFIIATRRSYADLFAKAFTDLLQDGAGLYFYDLTAKTNVKINENNRIFLSGYFGRDVFKFDKFQGMDWGNSTATLRWNHIYDNRLFSNYTVFLSNYDYGFCFGENSHDKFEWKSRILTYNFKPEYTWFINTKNELKFGGEAILYRFEPAKTFVVSNNESTNTSLDDRRASEISLYVGNDQHINEKLSVQYGIRYSSFSYIGGKVYHYADTIPGNEKRLISVTENGQNEIIESFGNLEPRISFRFKLSENASVKGSYNRMNQYIHLISNTTTTTPVDVWQPSTNNIRPEQGDQVTLGYFRNFLDNRLETSAELYYKWSRNQVEYIDGADIFVNEYLESQLLSGIGRSYGLELYVGKNTGRFTGWISYTLGKSELKVDGINFGNDKINHQGNWYPTRYDQRNNLKLVTSYDLTQKISISANFSYISGTPTTYPTDRITVQDYVIPYISGSKRNNVRIPDYHRLDLSVTFSNIWRGKKGHSGEDNLVISVYNLYARKNPFSIYFSQGSDRQTAGEPLITSSTQLSIIGTLIPAITYNIKF